MALFHVCYLHAFWRQTLKLAGSVYGSMLYGWQKFRCGNTKGTWPTWVWKRHLRMQNCSMRPRKEVPPDFIPRFADFVLQLAFGLKWPHSKFGMKPFKLGGGLPSKTLFFPCFGLFRSWLCFTSISLFPFSPYSSKLADWSFGQCFTTLWRVKVIEWKSRDLFLPPDFPPGSQISYCS